jgi:uncharacterized repeat protein (TIGR01451 family)
VYVSLGSVQLSQSGLYGNLARGGAGADNYYHNSSINGPPTYGGAGGDGDGGAQYGAGGSVVLTEDTVSSNTAQAGAAGLSNTLAADGSFIASPAGSALGGGIAIAGGSAVLANATLAGNQANAAAQGTSPQVAGGGLYLAPGIPAALANTIVAYNGAPTGLDVDGTVASSDHDLVFHPSGFSNPGSHDVLNQDPLLQALANNGGPTPTMALGANSPAIGAGDPTAVPGPTDQRGYNRFVGTPTGNISIDIGAYRSGAVPAATDLAVSGHVSPALVQPGGRFSYTVTARNMGKTAQADVTLAALLPAGTTLVSWTGPTTGLTPWTISQPPAGQAGAGTVTGQPGTVTAWTASLAAGASATFTLTLADTAPPGTALTTTFSVGPVTGDPKPANNSVTLSATVWGIADGGFEAPALSTGGYQTAPAGTPWTYSGGAGVAADGSALGNPVAPEGVQVGVLPGGGTISQAVLFPSGTLIIIFQAVQAFNVSPAETVTVYVDNTPVGTFTPQGSYFAGYSTNAFPVQAGTHTVTFQGQGTDLIVFLDQVRIALAVKDGGFEAPALGFGNFAYRPLGTP